MKKLFVISIGGSILVPGDIDAGYIKKFRQLIISQTQKGNRFVLNPGGGMTCRRYQEALSKIIKPTNEDLDWVGINTNFFHAKFLQIAFKGHVDPRLPRDVNDKFTSNKPVIIGPGGWKPGRSSDDSAVRLAIAFGAPIVINLSNIDYLFDKDPRKFKYAKKVTETDWNGLLKITGKKWIPGANFPFDPTAAQLAQKNHISLIIANGRNLKNLENILLGKKFIGTIIH